MIIPKPGIHLCPSSSWEFDLQLVLKNMGWEWSSLRRQFILNQSWTFSAPPRQAQMLFNYEFFEGAFIQLCRVLFPGGSCDHRPLKLDQS